MLPYTQLVHCLINGAVVIVAAVVVFDAVPLLFAAVLLPLLGAGLKSHVEQRLGQRLHVWLVLLYQEFEGHGLHIFFVQSNAQFIVWQEGLH